MPIPRDPLHEARMACAEIAKERFFTSDRPHHPFGFSYLGWSIEVHVKMLLGGREPLAVLFVSKVTHTGQLMELAKVQI